CPTFYGHMFMNPKDAPFAVAMVVLIMGLVRLIEEYPAPSPRTLLAVFLDPQRYEADHCVDQCEPA
ncbi:hypothetical protein, partial [Bradyrhizobium uaiense]